MRLARIGLTVWWVLLWAPAAPGQTHLMRRNSRQKGRNPNGHR
jgi:hypothetical protein